jgi:hypothetical protein
MIISSDKPVILGDGVDVANVRFLSDTENDIEYAINEGLYTVTPVLMRSGYVASVDVACDTPSQSIVIESGESKLIIYCVGVP